jgi:DNA polymerase III epsilon subunit family exonuclease
MTGDRIENESPRYEFLARRATDFLRDRGGRAREEDLIRHVFGNSSSPTLWAPLLRNALETEASIVLVADGLWAIPGMYQPLPGAVLRDFVALDVETTGLRPLTNRIIEVAAIRYRDGLEVDRFVTLLQPEKKLPSVIVNLTGIRDADLEDAPLFRDIADQLTDFLGDELIVGHNVGFDISFVAGELKRLARPGLGNPRFDTMSAANRLLVGLRRKSLSKLADYLGVPERKAHRAYDDAQRTAEVALRLVDAATAKGITETADVLKLGAPMPRASTDGNPHRRNVLDRSILASIPKTPGVYVMRDGFDQVIYIGKAKNLRDRVGSYFSQALGYTRKMDGLLESISTIRVEETGNELQALLLEAQLIRFYQPRYNTALRASESYPYIKINTGNLWPKVSLSKERKDDGSVYYGPYRSRSTANRVVDVINRVLPLRTCPRSFRNAQSFGQPCLKLGLGQCMGPCMGVADRGVYLQHIRSVLNFLNGDETDIAGHLQQRIERAAERLDFEKARELRADLMLVQSVAASQKEMAYAASHHNALIVLPSAKSDERTVLMVIDGLLWSTLAVENRSSARSLAVRLAHAYGRVESTPPERPDHASIDDTIILNRWMRKQSGHPAILPFDRSASVIDWLSMAQRALGLSSDDLHLDLSARIPEADGEALLDDDRPTARRVLDPQDYAEIGDAP